jgi:hypothetical protein
MRTDLIGGDEILAHVDALTEQHDAARQARIDADEALTQARFNDITAGAEHLRAGTKPPARTDIKAQKAADDAERNLAIVDLALRTERQAFEADVFARHDELALSLGALADDGEAEIMRLLDDLESLLSERATIAAHRVWIDDPSRSVGSARPIPVDGLRKQINAAPGTATGREAARQQHTRNVIEWNALVQRAVRNVDRGRLGNSVEFRGLEIDAAIEQEIETMMEADVPIPKPPNLKWSRKLGVGKFAGTSPLKPWETLPAEAVVCAR